MNQNFNYSNSFGFDQIQPQQQFDNHHPQEIPEVISFFDNKTKNELYKMMEDFTERMNQELRKQEALLVAQREQELLAQKQAAQEKQVPSPNSDFRQLIEEMCGTKVCEEQKQNMEDTMLDLLEICRQKELYCIHNNVDDLIESALNSKLILINLNSQHLDKEKKEVKNIESTIPLNKTPQISPVNAITHDLPTKEPDNYLSKGDKHLDTIPEMEKSSVKNLVPIPSESEDFSNNESECDMPVCDDFTTFSNPLFDSNDDFTSNPHSFNAESNLIESLLNRDALIDSSPKFDYLLEEFSALLYDNSSPRPPEERNYENIDTIIESPSPSPILVVDSDSHIEEINLFLASDDSMPPGIENDDYDSEGDIRFLEELLSNDPLPLPKIESSNLDHFNDPSSPRPPPEPPDVEICFDVEPDTTVKNDFDEPPGIESNFDPGGGEIVVS
ncbi:hypothetical protein Tco_0507921 [Tanacetum coccineum]